MMKSLLVLYMAVLCLSSTSVEASRCNETIMNMISECFWNNGHCVPKDVLKWAEFLGPWATKRASVREDNVICKYTVTEGNTVKLYKLTSDNAYLQGPKINTNIEENGILIEQESGNYGVTLYMDNFGVRAIYQCSPHGKFGAPRGVIKTAPKFKEEAVEQAIKDLEYLGITMSDQTYNDDCVPRC